MKTEKTNIRSFILRLAAFLLGLLSMCGGGTFLFSAFTLANQEFLHWYKPSSQQGFGDEIPVSTMMWEFAVEGIVLFPIGVFLTGFAVWPWFVNEGIKVIPTKPTAGTDPNPYSPPGKE